MHRGALLLLYLQGADVLLESAIEGLGGKITEQHTGSVYSSLCTNSTQFTALRYAGCPISSHDNALLNSLSVRTKMLPKGPPDSLLSTSAPFSAFPASILHLSVLHHRYSAVAVESALALESRVCVPATVAITHNVP